VIVTELWRYPVKSLQGERIDRVRVENDGLIGDRRFALFDVASGMGLTARRVPELLYASARWLGDAVEITLPDGSVARDDGALSAWLGRAVTLRHASFEGTRRFEWPTDIETEAEESWHSWDAAPGAFQDSTRVSLVSSATLRDWPVRRFRPNVVLDGDGEDALVGSDIRVGGCVLQVHKQIDRCVMVARPQPDGIDRDLDVLKTILRERAGFLAIGAGVVEEGEIAVGDQLSHTEGRENTIPV
jgi:uncharacterized protein YcbX